MSDQNYQRESAPELIARAKRLAYFYGYHWHADDTHFNAFIGLLERGTDVPTGGIRDVPSDLPKAEGSNTDSQLLDVLEELARQKERGPF
jgi:hypothetical protein